jgi:thiol-disulfide isomerase/thioredoxin
MLAVVGPGRVGCQRRAWTRRALLFRGGLSLVAAAVVVSSVLLAVSYPGGTGQSSPTNVRLPGVHLSNVIPGAPAITAADLESRAVVVNFWASWCGPCEKEMPTFQAAHRELGNRVVFVGIDESDTRAAAIPFLHHAGVSYRNGFDGNGTVGQSFVIPGTPCTFFISRGREIEVVFGALSAPALRSRIRQVFGV